MVYESLGQTKVCFGSLSVFKMASSLLPYHHIVTLETSLWDWTSYRRQVLSPLWRQTKNGMKIFGLEKKELGLCDFESQAGVFYQHEVYLQITRYEMAQSSCKRDSKSKSHPSMKLAPVWVFSCKHPIRGKKGIPRGGLGLGLLMLQNSFWLRGRG